MWYYYSKNGRFSARTKKAVDSEELEKLVFDMCGASPDHPFGNAPYPVYRHPENRKWFAIVITDAPGAYFGRESRTEALCLKCDPAVSEGICDGKRVFPAYHMNKRHWISLPLDEETDRNEVAVLIAHSRALTAPKRTAGGKKTNS